MAEAGAEAEVVAVVVSARAALLAVAAAAHALSRLACYVPETPSY